MKNKRYDYRSLIETYIAAELSDYVHPDFTTYYKRLLAALEKSFDCYLSFDGVRIERNKPLWMLFDATARSYHHIRTPADDFLEASLIVSKIDSLGDQGANISSNLEKIYELTAANRSAHFALLEGLFRALFGEITTTVTSAELLAQGLDDSSEPRLSDYDDFR